LTDYLEELLEHAEALLEQVKRLDQGLPGPEGRRAGETEQVSPAGEGEAVRGAEPAGRPADEEAEEDAVRAADRDRPAYREERPGEPGPAPEGDRAPEVPRRVRTPLEAEEGETSPLLDQLQRLERAQVRPGQAGPDRERSAGFSLPSGAGPLPQAGPVLPDAPDVPGTGQGGSLQSAASAAEELRWAERADRAFRRDSRRYDGGFYLY